MGPDTPKPETLDVSRTEEAVSVLGRAFEDDPIMRYLVAGKGTVSERASAFFSSAIRMAQIRGEVHVHRQLEGVAVWLRPGQTTVGFTQIFKSGLLGATFGMGVRSLGRFAAMYRYIAPLEDQHVAGPHWQLMFLGIDPPHQGKGLGGSLIAPVLERADAEGLPCYLDSGNPRNLSFYHRYGFEVAEEVQIPEGPRVWAMVRQSSTGR